MHAVLSAHVQYGMIARACACSNMLTYLNRDITKSTGGELRRQPVVPPTVGSGNSITLLPTLEGRPLGWETMLSRIIRVVCQRDVMIWWISQPLAASAAQHVSALNVQASCGQETQALAWRGCGGLGHQKCLLHSNFSIFNKSNTGLQTDLVTRQRISVSLDVHGGVAELLAF